MSIRMTFVLYALFSLLIGIIICILLISMVDRYRINLNYNFFRLLKTGWLSGTSDYFGDGMQKGGKNIRGI